MIYPSNFESKIGFDRIRELVREHCLFEPGRQKVDAMQFLTGFAFVKEEIDLTGEFREICLFEGEFPGDNYHDLTPALKKIKVEGTHLETEEVFNLKRSLDTIKAILRFFKNTSQEKYPTLKKLAGQVKYYNYIDERIDTILSKQGKIKDSASPELRRIRNEILQKQASVGKRLQSLLKKAIDDGYIEKDTAISIRNGRQVIPVPSSNKRRITGIIHDESATGRTAYVEPAEVVELNNEIRELEMAEVREIIKILIAFTGDIRPYTGDLLLTYDFLGNIDFIRAKALFALETGGVKPALIDETGFRWIRAVHPLLFLHHKKENKEVIPLDIYLDKKCRIILISGPNAGGKSVCLKTTGLIQYMLQCGMLVPMSESSEAGIFNDILIDIGDEQSIENDLSTYSSHLVNMKNFLRHASPHSLVLIDEFGTGTEPRIGGSIAEAILDALNRKGTYGVITTHYSNLKHFASSAEGIANGAMLFDTGKMQPLFRLEIGKPGSSFAIDIARQIGLPEDILKSASEKAGEEHINFDKHLREIIRDKRYWEDKRERIKNAEKRLVALLDDYEKELGETKKLRKEVLATAKQQAGEILSNANKEIEKTIRIIRESQADKETTKIARKNLGAFQTGIESENFNVTANLDERLEKIKKYTGRFKAIANHVAESPADASEKVLKTGDRVRLENQNSEGEVLDVNGDNVLVTFGESMITSVKRSSIEKIIPKDEAERRHVSSSGQFAWSITQRKLNFKPDIDIRGKRGEEALEIVKHFIDDATVVGVSELRILHGKGNGILKQLIREYLNGIDVVKSCRDEHVERGGSGITLVNLDF